MNQSKSLRVEVSHSMSLRPLINQRLDCIHRAKKPPGKVSDCTPWATLC